MSRSLKNKEKGDLRRIKWTFVIAITAIFFCVCSCSIFGRRNQIPVDYAPAIQSLPGGIETFWPDDALRCSFIDYWTLRYSSDRENSFEKEAPFFQEIVGRTRYENIIRAAAKNTLENLEILSIQRVNEYYYEIKITQRIRNAKGEALVLYIDDRWVYAGQIWYHVTREPFIFPGAN